MTGYFMLLSLKII